MASRENSVDAKLYKPFVRTGMRLQSSRITVTDGQVLDADMPPVLIIDSGGAADLVMPTPSEAIEGLTFWILNIDGTDTIDIESPADTVVAALTAGDSVMMHCDGAAWRAIWTQLTP